MNHRRVWRKIKRSEIPPDRRCVKTKWVFKIKRNGILRARLVAFGYSKITGVDYTANYAPVINDFTWSLLFILMLLKKFDGNFLTLKFHSFMAT